MSAIKLINSYPLTDTAEFSVYQGINRVARIGVHSGGEASIPTQMDNVSGTAQSWTIYAIVNGITTETVETNNPDATITLVSDNQDGCFLEIS